MSKTPNDRVRLVPTETSKSKIPEIPWAANPALHPDSHNEEEGAGGLLFFAVFVLATGVAVFHLVAWLVGSTGNLH